MSTHSYIGIINKDRFVDAVYCHWDGRPGHQGPILKERYNNAEKPGSCLRWIPWSSLAGTSPRRARLVTLWITHRFHIICLPLQRGPCCMDVR